MKKELEDYKGKETDKINDIVDKKENKNLVVLMKP